MFCNIIFPEQMTFDNKTKAIINSDLVREEARLPAVSSSVLFEIFPFVMVFGEDMGVQSIGRYQYREKQ